ncbi:MAG TPA: Crp/Fnr family transcriptional regulator [Streptosporangiaceae bacterium]|nr:Crp/Fnr family transcriptional regulator [Streptosporangiaceae bacterium]
MTGVLPAELGEHAFLRGLPAEYIARLAQVAAAVSVPAGHRFFEEGGRAVQIWLIRTGRVALDLHVRGREPLIVETVGGGQVVGLSWVCPPYEWQYGAQALAPTTAITLDTTAVLSYCDQDPVLGYQLIRRLMTVAADRLHASRIRLLDLYAAPSQQAGAT